MVESGRHLVVGCAGVQGLARVWRAVPDARTVSLQAIERMEPVGSAESGKFAFAVPLRGAHQGAICVAGRRTEAPSPADVALLVDLAALLSAELELRRDVSLRREAQDALLHGANHDELTGLPNRASFVRRLQATVDRAGNDEDYLFAVLFLDLDRFKVVNDSLGHYAGDELLIGVADRFAAATRPEDTVARLGGDEFAILLDGLAHPDDAILVAERIQATLRTPLNLSGYEVFTSASIGIVIGGTPVTGADRPEYVLRNADMAMYRAKAMGSASYAVFDRVMHRDALERLQLETELRHAVDRDEMVVHYQPVVSLTTGRVIGVEALVRWNHPERGLVAPDSFIHIAEDTGVIVPLGLHVLRLACRTALAWQGAHPQTLAVNLSARQFAQPGLIEQVHGVLEETGFPSDRLLLEITESAIIEHPEMAIETLAGLRRLGVRVYMDDFGTGYSSLNHLHKLPLDGIKIDRSFVARMNDDPKAKQLVRAVLSLAESLALETVAEGVTSQAQLDELRSLGCASAQCHFLAPPQPAEAIGELIERPLAGAWPEHDLLESSGLPRNAV